MTTTPSPIQRGHAAAALAIGTIALLMIGLQPVLLGELVAQKRITLEGVGLVAMGEIVALGLGVILGDALLPLARLRSVTVVAALCVALLDLATARLAGDAAFVAVRAAAGLAEGVLVWVTTCVIVRSTAPDRLAGIFLVVQTLAQAAVAALLAMVVIPRGGWQGGFAALAVLSLLPLLCVRALPPGVHALVATGSSRPPLNLATVLALAVPFLQMAAIGSLWAYLEPLGRDAGWDGEAAQTLVAGVLLMQVIGGGAAALVVRRWNAAVTLLAASGVLGAVALAIHSLPAGAAMPFAVLCALFGFAWLFLMPFHIRLAFRADAAGRVAMLVPAMQLLGSAFGPLVASFVVTGEQAQPVPLVSVTFAVLGACAVLACGVRGPRRAPVQAPQPR